MTKQLKPCVVAVFDDDARVRESVNDLLASAGFDLRVFSSAEVFVSTSSGEVWVSYNSPDYLKHRHDIPDELLKYIAGISAICEVAAR